MHLLVICEKLVVTRPRITSLSLLPIDADV